MKNSTAIILILISIGLYYTVISPQYAQIGALRAEADQYQNILSNASDITAQSTALEKKREAITQADVDKLTKVLPDSVNNVKLANDLATTAAQYGILLKSIKAVDDSTLDNVSTISPSSESAPTLGAPAPAPNNLQKVKVTVTILANYQSFRAFLADVEQSLRVVDVKKLSFKTTDQGTNEYSLELETYWLK